MSERPVVTLVMPEDTYAKVFDDGARGRLAAVAEVSHVTGYDDADQLARTDVLVTGWGTPRVDAALVARMPRLRAILHSAGSVRGLVAEDVWALGIPVSTQVDANAVPVAEFTLGLILLANKPVLTLARHFHETRQMSAGEAIPRIGNFGKRVGLIGASRIGRLVIAALAPHDLEVVVHDPFLSEEEARALGVTRVGLPELLATSDVVSVHAPQLPATRHMLDAAGLASMKDGAVLINTARGSLVDTDALVAELAARRADGRDLRVALDVTDPEPLPADHPLWADERVLLTPHIAGSLGVELYRLAHGVAAEVERLAAGEPLTHALDPATVAHQA